MTSTLERTGQIVSRSNAHTKFVQTVHRAWLMANLRNGLVENQIVVGDGDLSDYDDLGRASVVLAVAAMDRYFTEAFIEKLIPFLQSKKPTKELIKQLEGAGFGLAEALELLNEKDPYGPIKSTLENHLERYVTQSVEKIDSLFLAYGFKHISTSAEAKTKRKTVVKTIERLVRRRHQIVHDGDYMKSGKLRTVDQRKVTREVQSMEKFVTACDEILFR